MFEKVGQMAEQMATRASRRQFLGRFGRAAMTAAAAVAGIVALPAIGEAARPRIVCDATSDSTCVGVAEGSRCGSREYAARCKRVPGTAATCTCR